MTLDPRLLAATAVSKALTSGIRRVGRGGGTALPGLVADNRDGQRHLPLRIALRTGAPRLLWITIALTVLVVVALVVEGSRVGLSQ